MPITRVFKSGNSQSVRLPKPFRLDAQEVEISRRREQIVLKAKPKGLASAFHPLAGMPQVSSRTAGAIGRRSRDKAH